MLIPVVIGPGDAGALVSGESGIHGAGLVPALRPSTRKVFTLRLSLRFAVLLLAVVAIGFALGLYVLPYGLGWFASALILAGVRALLIAPKWLR